MYFINVHHIYCNTERKKKSILCSHALKRSVGAVRWRDAALCSEHLDSSPWPPPKSSAVLYLHIFTEHIWCEQTGGCGGLCLCNKSSSSMWFACPLPFPSQKRVTQDTRAEIYNLTLGLLLLHPLPTLSLNHPQQAARDYPIGSLWVVAVPLHLFIFFLPFSVSQPSLSYPGAECVPCQFY